MRRVGRWGFATPTPSRGMPGPTSLVERLQGTILQEHWRVAFRRRYFTSPRGLQHALDHFMRYYNRDRPHQGYRLRGRTPAALFRCRHCLTSSHPLGSLKCQHHFESGQTRRGSRDEGDCREESMLVPFGTRALDSAGKAVGTVSRLVLAP